MYNYIINSFGDEYTSFILAVGTVSDKGTIDEIGRALSRKLPNDERFSLSSISKIKIEYDRDPESTKEKHPEIFYYFNGIMNTAVSQSMHPAGIVVSPITLKDNYGEIYRDDKRVLQIDMDCVHDISLVKYDILGLKNIEIIKNTCENVGIKYPLSHEINWDDQKVWKDMLKSPFGIFQFEKEYAFSMLKEFKPKSIFDMSLVTAALRPSGASYRNKLMSKQINKNPSPIIDEMLKDNYGFLVYQEDVLKFLQEICGLSGSEADNVRRAIGRKQKDRLESALPDILEGYCRVSTQPRHIAEKEAKAFLRVIEDSAEYQFSQNHSVAYCMIGYVCAYLRYYYPIHFITAYLNNANNEEDINQGVKLAKVYGINMFPPTFGKSRSEYFIDEKTNSIYKGIASIKFLNTQVSEDLYKLAKENIYNSFIDLCKDIMFNTSTNTRQMEILIKCDYFKKFGDSNKLLYLFKEFKSGKNKITKMLKEKTVEKRIEELNLLEKEFKESNVINKDSEIDNIRFKIKNGVDFSVNINSYTNRDFIVIDLKTFKDKAKGKIYQIRTGNIFDVKFKSIVSQSDVLSLYDYIKVHKLVEENKWYMEKDKENETVKWKRYKDEDNQKELVAYSFQVINKDKDD